MSRARKCCYKLWNSCSADREGEVKLGYGKEERGHGRSEGAADTDLYCKDSRVWGPAAVVSFKERVKLAPVFLRYKACRPGT